MSQRDSLFRGPGVGASVRRGAYSGSATPVIGIASPSHVRSPDTPPYLLYLIDVLLFFV